MLTVFVSVIESIGSVVLESVERRILVRVQPLFTFCATSENSLFNRVPNKKQHLLKTNEKELDHTEQKLRKLELKDVNLLRLS